MTPAIQLGPLSEIRTFKAITRSGQGDSNRMLLRELVHLLERRFHQRDIDRRRVGAFEWGEEFVGSGPKSGKALQRIQEHNRKVLADSDAYFTPLPSEPAHFDFDGFWLRFPSAIQTPYPENNTVYARYFPGGDTAAIVLPQWNGDEQAHIGLCKALQRFGVGALRLSLPYHDRRRPDGLERADYMVGPNIGRTIQAVQQAVQDVRRAADWLVSQGVRQIGLMGTSIGSCVGWLAFVHDRRLSLGAFNHVSSYFGDVVWRGITTSHIRKTLQENMTQEEVRQAWLILSPIAYVSKLRGNTRPMLMLSALYDLSFPPDLSRQLFDQVDREGIQVQKVFLPCGHYTGGRPPFSYLTGYHLINFFRRRRGALLRQDSLSKRGSATADR